MSSGQNASGSSHEASKSHKEQPTAPEVQTRQELASIPDVTMQEAPQATEVEIVQELSEAPDVQTVQESAEESAGLRPQVNLRRVPLPPQVNVSPAPTMPPQVDLGQASTSQAQGSGPITASTSKVVKMIRRFPADITEDLRQQIEALDPGLYPTEVKVGGIPMDLSDIFSLRGGDGPPDHMQVEATVKRGRLNCVLGFPTGEPLPSKAIGTDNMDVDAPEAPQKPGETKPGKIFIGIDLDAGLAIAKQQQQQQQEQQSGNKKGKGKAKVEDNPSPQASGVFNPDVVKFSVHLDSQAPSIEIFTAKGSAESDGIISTRIFARDIAQDHFGWADISHTYEFDQDSLVKTGGVTPVSMLENMASHQYLLAIKIGLHKRPRTWGGLTTAEHGAIRTRLEAVSTKDKTVTRDLAVQLSDDVVNLHLYVQVGSDDAYDKWVRMLDYMRRLFTLCQYAGNYWFYRNQCEVTGFPREAIEDRLLPKVNFKVPRWLVTAWQFDMQVDAAGVRQFSNPVPYKHKYHRAVPYYPNPDETGFMLHMGIEGERLRQKRDLEELPHSGADRWFRGVFYEVPDSAYKGVYVVEVFMNLDDLDRDKGKLKMPGIGTRIQFEICTDSGDQPSRIGTVACKGTVVHDSLHHGATFVCIVNRQGPRGVATRGFEGAEYPVYISYIIDDTPHMRMMAGVTDIRAIPSASKPPGLDIKALFLGDTSPAPFPGFLADQLKEEPRLELLHGLSKLKPKLNEEQLAAATDALVSKTGLTTIVGPPGTGKSRLEIDIALVHAKAGRKVMIAAPQNEAVINLLDEFEGPARAAGVDEMEYVHFNGAYFNVKMAEKLRDTQYLESLEAENDMVDFIRSANTRAPAPQYRQTFGYKLRVMIDRWALDRPAAGTVPSPRTEWALSYLEHIEAMPQLPDREARKTCQSQLSELENLLGHEYLTNHVKFVFCTLSSSAHPLLIESFDFAEVVIDEAAHENLAGLATLFGAHKHHIQHATLAGDHMQGRGFAISEDSNVGYGQVNRNLFEELVTDPRKPYPVFLLKESYRMSNELLKWSNVNCYDGQLRAARSTANIDQPLRNTLEAYWSERTRDTLDGSKMQLAIDVSGHGIKDKHLAGTTTRYNYTEAEETAWIVRDMLAYVPPASEPGRPYRRILGKDIGITTPYTGQVLEMRRQLKLDDDVHMDVDSHEIADVLVATVNHIQGKQRKVIFFLLVINPGHLRLAIDKRLPISFMADVRKVNVALTRCRIARHVVGALHVLLQAFTDKHPVIHDQGKFFKLITGLKDSNCIVSYQEWRHYREFFQKPVDSSVSFARMILPKVDTPTLPDSAQHRDNVVDSAQHSVGKAISATSMENRTAEPAGLHYTRRSDNAIPHYGFGPAGVLPRQRGGHNQRGAPRKVTAGQNLPVVPEAGESSGAAEKRGPPPHDGAENEPKQPKHDGRRGGGKGHGGGKGRGGGKGYGGNKGRGPGQGRGNGRGQGGGSAATAA